MAALVQTLRRSRAILAMPGAAVQGVVCTERRPRETADPEVVDPAPPGHILQLVWERPPEDDDRETAELPDVDPTPLDPLPSTVRVVYVLEPAVLAHADIRRLHVESFGKDCAWRHLKPLMGAALPRPPPMQAAVRGLKVEVSADLPWLVAPLLMPPTARLEVPLPALDRHGHGLLAPRVCVVVQAATEATQAVPGGLQDPRRGPGAPLDVRGLVDGGTPGDVGVRVWGAKPGDPKVVAHIANLLGAPVPAQTTSVRVHGYPAQLGLAMYKYAQLRRYAQEAFGPEVPIRVQRCTQLAHSTRDRPVFNLELEGGAEGW